MMQNRRLARQNVSELEKVEQ